MSAQFDLSVYGILDPQRSLGRNLADLAADAVRGGATFLQLRDKHGSKRGMVTAAREILAAIAGSGVPLVINDRVDVALAANAHGVHIGENDMAPGDARALLGNDAIIGLTIHSVEEADAAPADVADYFGVGGIYATASKDNPNPPIGIAGFQEISNALNRRHGKARVVGIAGIDQDNAAPVIAAGADGVAVISCLFMANDVEAATRLLGDRVAGARRDVA